MQVVALPAKTPGPKRGGVAPLTVTPMRRRPAVGRLLEVGPRAAPTRPTPGEPIAWSEQLRPRVGRKGSSHQEGRRTPARALVRAPQTRGHLLSGEVEGDAGGVGLGAEAVGRATTQGTPRQPPHAHAQLGPPFVEATVQEQVEQVD